MEEEIVLCDTNVYIHWFNGEENTLQYLKKIGLDKMLISSVSVMELYKGRTNKNELKKLEQRLKSYKVLDFDTEISRMAKRFMYEYSLSTNLDIADAIIGASAIRFNLQLFTYNIKDFDFLPGIKLYKP